MSDHEPNEKARNAKKTHAEKLRKEIANKTFEIGQMAENIRVAMVEDDAEYVSILKDELKRLRAEREDVEDLLEHLEAE